MTLQNKGTYKDKLTIYVDPNKKDIIKKAKELFKKDNSSLSKFILAQLEEYVRLHYPGNPQLTWDRQSEIYYPPSVRQKSLKPSDCHFWKVRTKPTPPYQAYCSKYKRMVLAASCCDLWKA